MQQDLKTYYQEKADALRAEAVVLRRKTRNFVVAELVSFFAAVAFAVAYGVTDGWWPLLVAAGVAVLVYLWIRSLDVRSSARLGECESWLRVYEGELAALDGDFSHFDDGKRYADPAHPFTTDLDVFGPESLFQRIRIIGNAVLDQIVRINGQQKLPDFFGCQHIGFLLP